MNFSFSNHPQFPSTEKIRKQYDAIIAGKLMAKREIQIFSTEDGWFAIQKIEDGGIIVTDLFKHKIQLLWAIWRKTANWTNV